MHHQQIDDAIAAHEAWVLRRQRRQPCGRRLWVLGCMDERLCIERILGLEPGDAQIFRNAGAVVTDDAVRSAMLTTQLHGTREIIILAHTECGMMLNQPAAIARALRARGLDPDALPTNPALPELHLPSGAFNGWIRTFEDIDDMCAQQVELLRRSPLIPEDVAISGYIWEVESERLRRPHRRLAERVNSTQQMAGES